MDATAESGNLKIGGYEAWESGWTTYAKIPIFTLKKMASGKTALWTPKNENCAIPAQYGAKRASYLNSAPSNQGVWGYWTPVLANFPKKSIFSPPEKHIVLKFDKQHPAAPFCRPQDLTWWQMRVASVSGTLKIGGVHMETGPLGSKYDKNGIFCQKNRFLPEASQKAESAGGGGDESVSRGSKRV